MIQGANSKCSAWPADISPREVSADHELIWLSRDKTVPERKPYTVQFKKVMLMNSGAFHLIDVLAKGRKFNAAYYATKVLSLLSKWRSAGAKGDNRKLIMYADNAHALPNYQLNSLSRTG
jgi:hypothetical protein